MRQDNASTMKLRKRPLGNIYRHMELWLALERMRFGLQLLINIDALSLPFNDLVQCDEVMSIMMQCARACV